MECPGAGEKQVSQNIDYTLRSSLAVGSPVQNDTNLGVIVVILPVGRRRNPFGGQRSALQTLASAAGPN